MDKKNLTHIRVKSMDKIKIEDLRRELSIVQKADIKTPELIRRTFNIPNLKDVLIRDALNKRRGGI